MGENKHIEELDAFAKKYIKEIETESPSKEFTNSLMKNILTQQNTTVFKATPLISKKGWFVIFTSIIVLFFIPFKASEKSIFNTYNFSFFDNIQIPNLLESLNVSNTFVYSFLFFGLMMVIQVVYLKNHFNKRFQ